jgi:hypothetical protein
VLTLYLVVLGVAGVATAFAYLRTGEPFWYAAAEVVATFALLWFVLADAYPGLRPAARWIVPVVFLTVVAWEIGSALRDLRRMTPDPTLSARANGRVAVVAAAVTLALLAPALFAGARLSMRAF